MTRLMAEAAKWFGALFIGPSLVFASYLGVLQMSGNFHVVVPDQAYRSGQLGHIVNRYKIRTILNLRGPNTGSEWYQGEVRLSVQSGIMHHDFDMSANREVPNDVCMRFCALCVTLQSSF